MKNEIRKLEFKEFPGLLKEITDPPKQLFIRGNFPDEKENKFLCVVGSRKYTPYGKEACKKIIEGLAGYPIVIVSGLAIGIDSVGHNSALNVGLKTIAVPGSGLDDSVLYPSLNKNLAKKILEKGGALISEFEPNFKATPWSFPQRNRIMAGISHAVLVIEAEKISGTLITSRLATEYNRDVMTIPGSIFSKNSEGPHMLLRTGATPIICSGDILNFFDFKSEKKDKKEILKDLSGDEIRIIELLREPITKDELIRKLGMPINSVNILLSAMELKGLISEKMGKIFFVF
ncbi:DNA-processing protein DprA [Patescibacteria group bacterium]|nr:DNA-processing protein DprA [Patescibacteria group bacterium]MBU4057669.1 DNA-processing protein DprA [Patescibacteria group bacterium]MBU4115533.1 DNA-processing protein DprA [Patescibacteria group bacterium]